MGQGKDLDCLRSHDRDELATRSRMLQLETNRRRRWVLGRQGNELVMQGNHLRTGGNDLGMWGRGIGHS